MDSLQICCPLLQGQALKSWISIFMFAIALLNSFIIDAVAFPITEWFPSWVCQRLVAFVFFFWHSDSAPSFVEAQTTLLSLHLIFQPSSLLSSYFSKTYHNLQSLRQVLHVTSVWWTDFISILNNATTSPSLKLALEVHNMIWCLSVGDRNIQVWKYSSNGRRLHSVSHVTIKDGEAHRCFHNAQRPPDWNIDHSIQHKECSKGGQRTSPARNHGWTWLAWCFSSNLHDGQRHSLADKYLVIWL